MYQRNFSIQPNLFFLVKSSGHSGIMVYNKLWRARPNIQSGVVNKKEYHASVYGQSARSTDKTSLRLLVDTEAGPTDEYELNAQTTQSISRLLTIKTMHGTKNSNSIIATCELRRDKTRGERYLLVSLFPFIIFFFKSPFWTI